MTTPTTSARAASPILDEVERAARRFDPITLEELGSAELMDRLDMKFVVPAHSVVAILDRLNGDYRVLDMGGVRARGYRSHYFDTPHLELYLAHHTGRLPRYKVRVRSYLESQEHFLEVKLKTNKRRTLKARTPVGEEHVDPMPLLKLKSLFDIANVVRELELKEALTANFYRLSLVGRVVPERVTIDLGLTLSRGGVAQAFPGAAIVEIKHEGEGVSPAFKTLKSMQLREGALSKYCLGIGLLEPNAKKTRFKRWIEYFAAIGSGSGPHALSFAAGD
jgi:hypothetical protein